MFDPRDLLTDDVEALLAVLGGLLRRTIPPTMGIDAEEAPDAAYAAIMAFLVSKPVNAAGGWITAAALAAVVPEKVPAGVPLGPPMTADYPFRIDRVLASLSSREQEVVRLALTEQLSTEDIAAILDVTPAYAEKLIRRVSEKLLKRFVEETP